MISPVKDSDLAKQIELARQNIERWPEWLKHAVDVGDLESPESPCCTESLRQQDSDGPPLIPTI